MTHNTTTTTTGNVLPPGAKLCAGLRGGTDCTRSQTCARHTEIETTPGAVMVFASICGAADWAGYVKAAS
jgi:hypothetical protein